MKTVGEGDEVVYTGRATDDGPAPGDACTVVAMAGSGAWVLMRDGELAGEMPLVYLDDLEQRLDADPAPASRRADRR